ncbi:MAG: DUF3987 domain-containing protein [Alkalinema sp. RU_4_3]|nr:DUF3987 domain-containing protein [Alkalinema sp. RU_4_3]
MSFQPDQWAAAVLPIVPQVRRKSRREKDKDAIVGATLIECEVDQWAARVASGSDTPAQAEIGLKAWAKAHGHDAFSAAKLLVEKLKQSKVIPIREGLTSVEELPRSIANLLERGLTGSKLQTEKAILRQSSGLSDREFASLWESVEGEIEGDLATSEAVALLLDSKETALQLSDILPMAIAAPLSQQAEIQSLRPELYMLSLLTTIGTLAQNRTSLLLHKGLDFEVTPNIFGAIVAESSQKKSPVLKTVVSRPLKALNKEARNAYQRAIEAWRERQTEAKRNDEFFNEPEPARELYFFTNATGESILAQADRCPKRGLLALSDELAGSFKSANQYRGGRGSDSEDLLSFYDGSGGVSLRVDGIKNDVEILNYGVLGGIQPRVLQKFLGNCEDANGGWARFIFVNQPIAASTLPNEFWGHDISDMLTDYYRRVSEYAPRQYRLDSKAFEFFQECYNRLEQTRISEPNPALRAVIGKTSGRIGKLALGLHLIESAVLGITPPELITEDTVYRASVISKFAIDQIKAIYAECDPEEQQAPVMARIVELSRRKGAITAREASQGLPTTNRPKTAEIRQHFVTLAAEGFGELEGEGRSATFTAYPSQRREQPPTPETAPTTLPTQSKSTRSKSSKPIDRPPTPIDRPITNSGRNVGDQRPEDIEGDAVFEFDYSPEAV